MSTPGKRKMKKNIISPLRKWMKANRWNAKSLSIELGFHEQYFYMLFNGKINLRLADCLRIESFTHGEVSCQDMACYCLTKQDKGDKAQ